MVTRSKMETNTVIIHTLQKMNLRGYMEHLYLFVLHTIHLNIVLGMLLAWFVNTKYSVHIYCVQPLFVQKLEICHLHPIG
jgi:hypothetical protein